MIRVHKHTKNKSSLGDEITHQKEWLMMELMEVDDLVVLASMEIKMEEDEDLEELRWWLSWWR